VAVYQHQAFTNIKLISIQKQTFQEKTKASHFAKLLLAEALVINLFPFRVLCWFQIICIL